MSSGWEVDRVVEVGLPGCWAEFSLGHGWASGEPDEAVASSYGLYYGFREDVDPLRLAPFPGLTVDRWKTRQSVLAAIEADLAGRTHPHLWSFEGVAYSHTGHPRMVAALVEARGAPNG